MALKPLWQDTLEDTTQNLKEIIEDNRRDYRSLNQKIEDISQKLEDFEASFQEYKNKTDARLQEYERQISKLSSNTPRLEVKIENPAKLEDALKSIAEPGYKEFMKKAIEAVIDMGYSWDNEKKRKLPPYNSEFGYIIQKDIVPHEVIR